MPWKFSDGLEECSSKNNINCLREAVHRRADQICDGRVSKASSDHGDREKEQWSLKLLHEDQRVAPACFPLPQLFGEWLHMNRVTPSMGRRTAIRRTLS